MRTMRIGALGTVLFGAAFAMSAQTGTVQNAAIYQSESSEGIIFNPFFAVTVFPYASVGELSLFGYSPNIISPRMLAVLSYPVSGGGLVGAPAPPPVNATLFLRPAGSSSLIPIMVTNAVAGAITFVVPAGVPLGGAELLYQIDDGPTQWTTVDVVQSSFAFFANGPSTTAPRAIGSNGSSTNVGLTTPVQPGQTLVLTGSGLGYGTAVTATIGGAAATVVYSGPSGTQSAGHDEIWLQVPAGVADGCYVPVTVMYNETPVSITVSETSDGMPCKHPWGLSVSDMKNLDAGGYLAFGEIDLSTDLSVVTVNAGSRDESAYMNVSEMNAAGLAGYFPPPAVVNGCSGPQPVANAVFPAYIALDGIVYSNAPTPPTPPVLGASVTLQSPTTTIAFTNPYGEYEPQTPLLSVDGPLSDLPTPAIAGGKWTWQSPGSADLAASSFGFTLPPPIQLNGGVPVLFNRTQNQTLSWNGSAFDSGATVYVSLSGSATPVSCTVAANAGSVTIPASLLASFADIGTLTISLNEASSFLPHALLQLTNGNTLLTIVSFSSEDARPVFFQ